MAPGQPATTVPTTVVGGGAPTGYAPANSPVQVAPAYVPAPTVATAPPAKADPNAQPPEPIDVPGVTTAALPGTTAPTGATGAASTDELPAASTLANWPTWKNEFAKLGMPAAAIEELGAAPITEAALADVFARVEADVKAGSIPAGKIGAATPTDGTSTGGTPAAAGGWSDAWAEKFAAAGADEAMIAEIKAQATEMGATDAELQSALDSIAAEGGAAKGGWNEDFAKRFKELGAPDEIIAAYADSGTSAEGLEKAYDHAKKRVEDFRAGGWYDDFKEAGMPEARIWADYVLADTPKPEKALRKELMMTQRAKAGTGAMFKEMGFSLIPGVQAVQYALGKNTITDSTIDRSGALNIGLAALSGVAAIASIRGGARYVGSLKNGVGAISRGLPELTKAGVTTAGQATKNAAMGPALLRAMGTDGKVGTLDLLRSGALRSRVRGLGNLEAAAKAANSPAAKHLDPLQKQVVGKLFDDIKRGRTLVDTNRMSNMPFASGAPAEMRRTLVDAKPRGFSKEQLLFNSKNAASDGRSQLASMLQAGGTKLASKPDWVGTEATATALRGLGNDELAALGTTMAGSGVKALGGVARDGRPASALSKLGKHETPEWYSKLAATASTPGTTSGGGAAAATTSAPSAAAPAASAPITTTKPVPTAPTAAPAATTASAPSVRYTTPSGIQVTDNRAVQSSGAFGGSNPAPVANTGAPIRYTTPSGIEVTDSRAFPRTHSFG